MNRIAILYTPAGGGHKAAANAIAAELAGAGAVVEVRNVLDFAPSWFAYDRAWKLIQRHGGVAWDALFDVTERGWDVDAIRLPLNGLLFASLDRWLIDFAPTHVVCTHYLPALAVTRVREKLAARVIVTVTDHQAHRAWVVPGVDAYCVPDVQVARAIARRTRANVIVTGVPIARCDRPVRGANGARVLALLGSVPARDARIAIDSLVGVKDLEVLAGEHLEYARAKLPHAQVAARADGLYAAIDRADVVVTKAGGLTVAECMARGRAMVLPFAAPGQERGNVFYALHAGAAVRAELPDLGDVLAELVAEPGTLRKMGTRARFAAHPDAAAQVVRALLGTQEVARVA
ncbi:MAG: hypothetical protein QM831_08710 [Kofleriaceae bacterium]